MNRRVARFSPPLSPGYSAEQSRVVLGTFVQPPVLIMMGAVFVDKGALRQRWLLPACDRPCRR